MNAAQRKEPPMEAQCKVWRLHWRRQLHRLAELDLPLLAVGAGPERKAPASLRNGELLTGWTTAKHTPSQLHDAHKKVIAAGTRTGNPTSANRLESWNVSASGHHPAA